jgi:Putative adhesin
MLRTALVALLVGAVLTACGIRIVRYAFEDDHVVAEKFTSVRARTDSGDVSIRFQQGLTETKIHRKIEHEKDNRPSGISHRVEGTALVLDSCGNDCDIDYEILVPSADITLLGDVGSGDLTAEGLASVEYKTGSGKITVRDIKGDVKATAGSGDFEATRVAGAVTADLGSGRISLDAVKGKMLVSTSSGDIEGIALDNEVVADAGSGRVELTLSSARSVRVDARSGDIMVRLPGGPYKLSGSSGHGEREISVPTDSAASLELRLSTGSGDVRVLGM